MSRKRAVAFALICAVFAGLFVISTVPASASGGNFALLIGVARFQGRTPSLPGSDSDANDTRQFLLNNGWSSDGIRTLTNQQATASSIREGLAWLASRCGPGTTCVFKYSGHVKQNRANDGDSEVRDENLWTYEGAFIPDGTVAGYLKTLSGRAWIDISGCEAAGFDDNVSSINRVFTASSQENQKSYESPAYKNSVWTELLVNQGLAQGKNLAEAFSFAKERAEKETAGQRNGPQTAYLAGADPRTWFNRAPPPAAPGTRTNCLLGLICL